MVSLDRDVAHHTRVESDNELEPLPIIHVGDPLAPPLSPAKNKREDE